MDLGRIYDETLFIKEKLNYSKQIINENNQVFTMLSVG